MTFTPEQMNKAKSAKSAEELLEMAKAEGVEMTADEAAKYFADLHTEGELNEDELATIAGGKKKGEDPHASFYGINTPNFDDCPVCGARLEYVRTVPNGNSDFDVVYCPNGKVYLKQTRSRYNCNFDLYTEQNG